MYKYLLAHKIFRDSGVELGLSWENIYLGRRGPMEGEIKIKHYMRR